MIKNMVSMAAILAALASPAYAGGHDNTPPPAPTPAPNFSPHNTNLQGQAQGQLQGQKQNQKQGQNQLQGQQSTNNNNLRGGNQGQSQTVNVENNGNGSNNPSGVGNGYGYGNYPVSSATAPSFGIGGCQWAISGGFQVFGAGVSGGGAGLYEFCKPLMKAGYFHDRGQHAVAKNLECNYPEFKEAYRMAGEPCRNDMSKAEISAADAQATQALSQPGPVALNTGGVQCVDAAGRRVALGQPGAVRCE